jgi:subfamily B ATP-binding cassette protein MsbA
MGGRVDRNVIRRLITVYLAPHKLQMAFAAFAAIIVAGTTAGSVWLMSNGLGLLLDPKRAKTMVYLIPVGIVAAFTIRAVAMIAQNWTVNSVGHRVVGKIQVELFGAMLRADLSRLRSTHSGSLVSSMLYDAALVRGATTVAALNFLQSAVQVIALVGVMIFSDFRLTLIISLAGPVLAAVIMRFSRWTKKAAIRGMAETAGLSSAIMEGIDGIKTVKVDNREAYEVGRVAAAVARRQVFIIKGANIGAATAPVIEVITSIVLAGFFLYAGLQVLHDPTRIKAYAAILTSLLIASQSVRQLSTLQSVFSEGFAAAGRIFAAIDVRAEVTDAPDAIVLSEPAHGVAFDNVGFAYAVDGEPALNGVSLAVERGETIALVGPSGGGKSTVLNLIPRFYDVSSGAITIDGRDIRGLTLASLRDQIGLVTQEPFLFDDTVRANIAYPRPEATQDEIEAAARDAAAHDFIMALPKGYDTPVGEAGARLSGGQRQRIAIARAFLKNAPILLLDEATSALDTESEAQVQVALERLMAGRATILIAHRLSTVKNADRIYVIDRGRVVETGTHDALVRSRGLYARLARAQNLEPTPEAAE